FAAYRMMRWKQIWGLALVATIIHIIAVILIPVKSERRLSLDEMNDALIDAGGTEIPVESASTVGEAIEQSRLRGGKTLVAGSLFLVGETLGLFRGESFEISLQ
ncbi:MAG: hypothetical protein ABL994_26345, partial [Verrucomicrobiales bacterium]